MAFFLWVPGGLALHVTLRTPACSSLGASGHGAWERIFSLGRLGLPPCRWDTQAHVRWGTGGQRLFRGQWKQQSGWGPIGDLEETGNAGGPAQGFLQDGSVARDEHTRSISCLLRQPQRRTSLGEGLPSGSPEGSG